MDDTRALATPLAELGEQTRAYATEAVVVNIRHAHASHALDRGAPIHLVSARLGHADLRTTSAYTHARPGDSSARYLAV
jgi:site-specific recombinase XerD